MIKINSELPLCMLKDNNELNDYDFVLFHLYKSNKSYKEYFLNQRKEHPNRLMIFDNSAYEFYVKNETLNMGEFYNAICELNPDYYILPDTLMNMGKTIADIKSFLNIYGKMIKDNNDIKSVPLAVTQGNNEYELIECLKLYKRMGIDAIAIPFHNSFFREMEIDEDIMNKFFSEFGPDNIDAEYAMGRVQFMRNNKTLLQSFNHVHILGSHQPFEKKWYYSWDTMDTGYPVKLAMENVELGEDIKKPEIIIDEFFENELDDCSKTLIEFNIKAFKNM